MDTHEVLKEVRDEIVHDMMETWGDYTIQNMIVSCVEGLIKTAVYKTLLHGPQKIKERELKNG